MINEYINDVEAAAKRKYENALEKVANLRASVSEITDFENKLKELFDVVRFDEDDIRTDYNTTGGWYVCTLYNNHDQKNQWGNYSAPIEFKIIVGKDENGFYTSGFASDGKSFLEKLHFTKISKQYFKKNTSSYQKFLTELENSIKIINSYKDCELACWPVYRDRWYYYDRGTNQEDKSEFNRNEIISKVSKMLKIQQMCKERRTKADKD